VQLLSFGYKNGTPASVDFMFDARCLPNPHWVSELRRPQRRDAPVAAFLEGTPETQEWFAMCATTCAAGYPASACRIAPISPLPSACTGGQHRSVYLVERLGRELRGEFEPLSVKHRDLGI